MALHLSKPFPRLWSLDHGTAMIITDLHGDWAAYQRYRDRFVDLQAHGRADCIIFTGDLIHRAPITPDHSLEIVLDILQLQAAYGDALIYLCGNHELPHRYGFVLSKGTKEAGCPTHTHMSLITSSASIILLSTIVTGVIHSSRRW